MHSEFEILLMKSETIKIKN